MALVSHEVANCETAKTNLIINYLPQTLTDQEFHELFESVGRTTSTRVIRDKSTNYSFGYGFVNYVTSEDAARAIEQLNGQMLQHKTIKVAYSQPSGPQTKNINLHVSGLPENTTDDMLEAYFIRYGMITQCRIVKDKQSGKCQGFGFVLFSCRDEALAAIKGLNGTVLQGTDECVLTVKFAKVEQKGPPSSYVERNASYTYDNNSSNNADENYDGDRGAARRGGGPMRGHSFRGRYSPMTPTGGYNNNYSSYNQYNSFNPYNAGSANETYFGSNDMGTSSSKETIVFIYGIGPQTNEDILWQMFTPFGNIVRVNVIYDHAKGAGKGYGFVTYSSYNEASYAIQSMNGTTYQGRQLQVSVKT